MDNENQLLDILVAMNQQNPSDERVVNMFLDVLSSQQSRPDPMEERQNQLIDTYAQIEAARYADGDIEAGRRLNTLMSGDLMAYQQQAGLMGNNSNFNAMGESQDPAMLADQYGRLRQEAMMTGDTTALDNFTRNTPYKFNESRDEQGNITYTPEKVGKGNPIGMGMFTPAPNAIFGGMVGDIAEEIVGKKGRARMDYTASQGLGGRAKDLISTMAGNDPLQDEGFQSWLDQYDRRNTYGIN